MSTDQSNSPVDSRFVATWRPMLLRVSVVLIPLLVFGGSQGWSWWKDRALQQKKEACRLASKQGDWRELQRLASNWVSDDPRAADAWLNLAEAESELGHFEEAATALGNVGAEDPRAPAALLEKAGIEWEQLNKPVAGLETCQRIVEINGRSIEAHARIIAFYAMSFQRSEMLEAIRRSILEEGEPREAYVYLLMADQPIFTNAVDLNARWLASDPNDPQFRIGLAIQTAMHRFLTAAADADEDAYANEQEALGRLAEFAEQYPNNPNLLSVLLDYYVEEGDADRVATLLAQVPRTAVKDHMIWTCRGWYQAIQKDLAGAHKSLENALKLHPSSQRALHEMAAVLRAQGELEKATKMQALADQGVKLRKRLVKLEGGRDASMLDLYDIGQHLKACGDEEIAAAIQKRLEAMPGYSASRLKQQSTLDVSSSPDEDRKASK